MHSIESDDVDEIVIQPYRIPLSRPCYDKFHRCPGRAGGGFKYPKIDHCRNGYIRTYTDAGMFPGWKWRFYSCGECGVYVLPYMSRYLDPSWLRWRVERRLADLRYRRRRTRRSGR